ncbi:hypothetical protein GQ457_01G035360 [Hibiscus cannabinus]
MVVQDYSSVKLEPVFDDLGADNFLEKSTDDYLERFKAVVTLRLPQIMAKLRMSKSENPTSCLVHDSIVPWALDIAKDQGVYGVEFFTMSCAMSTVFYNVHEGLLKVPINVEPCVSVAGLPLLQARDLPSFISGIHAHPTFTQLLTNQFSSLEKADWVFFNTFTSLENEVVNWISKQWPIKTIGPTIASKYLDKRVEDDGDYGIHLFMPEMDICSGLFYESLRSELDDEALSLGVPMVTVLQLVDQPTNAKFIVDEWQMGIRAEVDEKGIIREEEIERCIREIMEGDASEDIKRNAVKWKKVTMEAELLHQPPPFCFVRPPSSPAGDLHRHHRSNCRCPVTSPVASTRRAEPPSALEPRSKVRREPPFRFRLFFLCFWPLLASACCTVATIGFLEPREAKPNLWVHVLALIESSLELRRRLVASPIWVSIRFQTPSSSIVCLAQPVRSAQFCEPVITGSSTVAERFRYLLDRSELLFQILVGCPCSWHWRIDTYL